MKDKDADDKKDFRLQDYEEKHVSISNMLIRAKERTSILESKIEILAMYRMDNDLRIREKKDGNGNVYEIKYVVLSVKDLRNLTGRDGGEFYNDILRIAFYLKEKMYMIKDSDKKSFLIKYLYLDVGYDDGKLTIEFNPDLEKYYINLKEDYTKMSLSMLFSFHKNGGLQLYKLLKSYAFNLPKIDLSLSQEEFPEHVVSFNLSELKMTLGYVDISQEKLREEGRKKNPDFEKMILDEKKPQYKEWKNFSSRVIAPGIEEINNISDIRIKKMEKILSGRGGKVTGLTFHIQHNRAFYESSVSGQEKDGKRAGKKDSQTWTEEARHRR